MWHGGGLSFRVLLCEAYFLGSSKNIFEAHCFHHEGHEGHEEHEEDLKNAEQKLLDPLNLFAISKGFLSSYPSCSSW
jgi:hypothetical protein